MNVPVADLASLNVRYIIPLDEYYQLTDEKTRQMVGVWVNGIEHLYKMALFILDQQGLMQLSDPNQFIRKMHSYLTEQELTLVCQVVSIITNVLRRELLPLLAHSGASIHDINLVSIQEQIMGEYTSVNGIFVFSYRSATSPENFRTLHPVFGVGSGTGLTPFNPVY